MRFVRLRPGCVAGLGDMMSERERERCCDTGADTWSQLGPGPPLQPLYCVLCPPPEAGDEGGGEDEEHPGARGRG